MDFREFDTRHPTPDTDTQRERGSLEKGKFAYARRGRHGSSFFCGSMTDLFFAYAASARKYDGSKIAR